MEVSDFFPMWKDLTYEHQERIRGSAVFREAGSGEVLFDSKETCSGLILVCSGQLRAFHSSEDGREITLYRLLEGDICILKASCIINSLQIDIDISAEKASSFFMIPPDIYKELMESSVEISGYTGEIMAGRMSEIVWLMEQIMWKSFDRRLAAFLLEESVLESSDVICTTHEQIANHLGTAREVVTRMLKYFRSEGLVELSRGEVRIVDRAGLEKIAG